MTGPCLIDTNVLIDMANGKSPLGERIARTHRVYISPIVHGEFLAGIRAGDRHRAKQRSYDILLSLPNVSIPALTAATADRYARLWQFLSDSGHRIPANDIWIAAHALELSATLVTADRHFSAIPTLPLLLEGD
jgi:predicted nucleic acid-binding protein